MNAAKARGTRWETAVVDYLSKHYGWNVFRLAQMGVKDKGDLEGVPEFGVECKDEARITLSAYLDQARKALIHNQKRWAVAIVKRRNKGVQHAYAVMELEAWAQLVHDLVTAEDNLRRFIRGE